MQEAPTHLIKSSKSKENQASLYIAISIVFSSLAMPPYGYSFLGYVALFGLIRASINASSTKRALAYGLIYGFLSSLIINSWILNLSIIGWLASTWLSIFPALFSLLIAKSKKSFYSPLWWASVWVSLEALRTLIIPFGFNPLSSSTNSLALLQNAAWGSGYIISFALVLSSGTLALLTTPASKRDKLLATIIGLLVYGLLLGYGSYRLNKSEELNDIEKIPMAIMSSQIPFSRDLGNRWQSLEDKIEVTENLNSAYLNVWAESIGFALLTHQPSWDKVSDLALKIPGPLLLTSSFPIEDKIYNTSILIENSGKDAQLYRKRFLTPIGEYIPSFIPKSWISNRRHPGNQDGHLTMLVSDGAKTRPYRIGVLVCLEETLSIAAKDSLSQGAEIFISPSNHGDTLESCALQQEAMARIRAIECATPLVRIGNMGKSNVYDSLGKKVWESSGEGIKMSVVQVPILRERQDLFPNNYLKIQDWTLYILVFGFVIGLLTKKNNTKTHQK